MSAKKKCKCGFCGQLIIPPPKRQIPPYYCKNPDCVKSKRRVRDRQKRISPICRYCGKPIRFEERGQKQNHIIYHPNRPACVTAHENQKRLSRNERSRQYRYQRGTPKKYDGLDITNIPGKHHEFQKDTGLVTWYELLGLEGFGKVAKSEMTYEKEYFN